MHPPRRKSKHSSSHFTKIPRVQTLEELLSKPKKTVMLDLTLEPEEDSLNNSEEVIKVMDEPSLPLDDSKEAFRILSEWMSVRPQPFYIEQIITFILHCIKRKDLELAQKVMMRIERENHKWRKAFNLILEYTNTVMQDRYGGRLCFEFFE